MRKTVIEFPKKRLEELIKEEERVLNSINNVKNELDILEREYSIICARHNELESLLKYSTHDENVLRDLAEKTTVVSDCKHDDKALRDLAEKTTLKNTIKPEEYQYTPDCDTGVMRKTIAKTHNDIYVSLANTIHSGVDLSKGLDMPPENRKGVVK